MRWHLVAEAAAYEATRGIWRNLLTLPMALMLDGEGEWPPFSAPDM